eukprot:tig00020801_g13923.t1
MTLPAASAPASLRLVWGRANEFKEGDASAGLAAASDAERAAARAAIAATPLAGVRGYDFVDDAVTKLLESSIDAAAAARAETAGRTIGDLRSFLLSASGDEIRALCPGLRSEVIAGVCKLMSNNELSAVSAKIYNPQGEGGLGAEGYLSSRIQPNSPTDDPEEVLYNVLEGLSYGCGDALLGINVVAGDAANVRQLERVLRDVVETFSVPPSKRELEGVEGVEFEDESEPRGVPFAPLRAATRWCVLGHIDAQVRYHYHRFRGQLRGTAGQAQYFETGQGSAATNGAAHGVDMVTLEARAHGLARALARGNRHWTLANTVAGFIGPEVFRTPAQLLRACLEDLFMGKLHGLTFGLDVCSTYHMGVDLPELEAIAEEVARARPAFFMALPGPRRAPPRP